MVNEIRVYVEGGGDGAKTKARLREGFSNFLREIVKAARNKSVKWQIIVCGSRNEAFDNFTFALQDHPAAFNVLLVDSEDPVHCAPWQHLQGSAWIVPGVSDEHCHLMVQMMEAWFVADIDALSGYYGQGFKQNSIPRNPNVEEIDKERLKRALDEATRHTAKGKYQKIRHASELLARIDSAQVRQAAPHCDRLFTTLIHKMD